MNSKLFVGNLAYSTTEAELRELFGQAGTIRAVTIPMDRATERPRGFAFVEMDSPAEAQKAISMCNGQTLGGRQINVNEARPPEQRSGGAGGGRDFGAGRDFGGGGRDRDRGDRRGGGRNDRRY
ncbi:MAG: RNA-binding protein [Chloroflexi bacterium]|nr:RNA-binding protein [Chloroflexota bacterium]